jgi:regulator of protease activity HflC (stomatin/prohibitin superfamily)
MNRIVGLLAVVVGVVILLMLAFRTVPAGHVGVVDLFGRVGDETLAPGLHLVNPLARVHRMSVQTRQIKEVMDTPSSEGLTVHLEISTIFHLNPAKAVEVYKTVGLDYDEILLHPNIRSAVREITSSYEAKALYSPEREKMGQQINEHVRTTVEPRGVLVESVLLRDVKLPERLQASIQEKLSAEQEAARMQFVLMKEQREAERKKIEGEGIATFQKIVTEGISENLLKWKGIEATKELATSPNAKIVIIGGKDGLPVILGSDAFATTGHH